MTKLNASIYINAPTAMIDAIALNPHRIPEWFVGVERVETDRRFPDIGGSAKLVLKWDRITMNLDAVSEELIQGLRFVYRTEGLIKGLWTWSLKGEASGNRVTVTADYELTDPQTTTAENGLLERMIAEDLEKSLKNLAVLVQAERALYMTDQ